MSAATKEIDNEWTVEEKKTIPPLYGCEILLENTTLSNTKDTSFPSDAYVVMYKINDKNYIDLCRGTMMSIFDMYYDKFGPDTVQEINWGNGRVSPNLWGYKAPTKSKKRK